MYTLYYYIWFFLIYACLGWCLEVAYAVTSTGKFSNRGFLNGPVCPIYGCGMVLVILVLTPIAYNTTLLFAGALLLASVLEYFTGLILEKLFHAKWWDYSELPFNIQGYVCLKFSIGWGGAGVGVMKVVQPTVYKIIDIFPRTMGYILMALCLITFLVDIIATVTDMVKFMRRIKTADVLAAKLKDISDEMALGIYEGVINAEKGADVARATVEKTTEMAKAGAEKTADVARATMEKTTEMAKAGAEKTADVARATMEKTTEMAKAGAGKTADVARATMEKTTEAAKTGFENKRAEFDELKKKYSEIIENNNFTNNHFMRAFPSFKKGITDRYKNKGIS